MIKNKILRNKIVCAGLIVVGAGLCIGGIFVPFLLAIGTPIFAAGLGMFAKIMQNSAKAQADAQTATPNPNFRSYSAYGETTTSESKKNTASCKQKKTTIYRFHIKSKDHEPQLYAFNAQKEKIKEQEHDDRHAPAPAVTEIGYEGYAPELLEQIRKLNDIIEHMNIPSQEHDGQNLNNI